MPTMQAHKHKDKTMGPIEELDARRANDESVTLQMSIKLDGELWSRAEKEGTSAGNLIVRTLAEWAGGSRQDLVSSLEQWRAANASTGISRTPGQRVKRRVVMTLGLSSDLRSLGLEAGITDLSVVVEAALNQMIHKAFREGVAIA
jgi:hypothetical protein